MQDTKSVVFIYINNEFTKKEIKKTISFTIAEEKRGFLWEQMGTGAEHPQHFPRRVTPLGGWGTPCKRGRKDYRRHRDWRTPREHAPPKQPKRAHMGSQSLKWQAWVLHGSGPGSLLVCYGS